MRTRTRFSLRLARRLLALAAAFLLAATAALADQASLVSTAAPGNSILDDVLGEGGITPIQCVAPSGDPCDSSGPASIGTGSGANLGAGNPIHLASGNKYRRETDLPALPGVMGLEIVRHYNSTLAEPARPMGILGRGWRLSYETGLAVFKDAIHILQADGSRVFFARTGKGTLSAHDPAYGQLHVRGPATRPEEFQWHWPDGRRLDFDARGRLLQIIAPEGHFVSLLWAPDGSLLRVTDPQGRSLVFEYAPRNSSGFRGVVAMVSPVGRFTLAHQNDRAVPGLSNLVAVTDPEGGVRRYHYGADVEEFAPHLPHHLTGISVEAETGPVRIATYAYDARGRATLSVRGEPLRTDEDGQPVPGTGLEQVSVDYREAGMTVVTNSLGERTTYRHAVINSGFRLIEAIGPGCASCGPSNRRYAYDKLGRMVEEIKLGADRTPISATLYQYDARGRVLSRAQRLYLDGAPGEPRTIARYAYSADSPRPTLIARPSVVPGREHRTVFEYNDHSQILSVTEAGFSPLGETGEPVATPEAATPIERTTTYTYTRINGRSLLAEIDGPLPNGPANDPTDSDITRFDWEAGGNRIARITRPGERIAAIEYAPSTGMVRRVSNHVGSLTEFDYNTRLQPVRIRSHGAGWQHPREMAYRFDPMGQLVETLSPDDPARNMRFAHDPQGRLEWAATALGVLETLEHDTEGRLIGHRRVSASFEQSRFWRYDKAGRVVSTGNNRGWQLDAAFDARGQLESLTDAQGISYPGSSTIPAPIADATVDTEVIVLHDDFGNAVWRHSPDTGEVRRQFDAAGRLVGMRDAQGNLARYDYDVRGRIARQLVTDADTGQEMLTTWRYQGEHLIELEHPTQRERYEYDARGLRVARIVTLATDAGALTAVTRYKHDEAGRLVATTLPDGSRLSYARNGQAQVVSLTRSTVRTPWLRRFESDQVIATDFERDLFGLRSYTAGNGTQTLYERGREGALARTVHRHRHPAPHPQQVALGTTPAPAIRRNTSAVIERILGIAPAHASDRSRLANAATLKAPIKPILPGTLDSPSEPDALLDHRYLWNTTGYLLLSRQHVALGDAPPTLNSHAYDADGRLIASVRWRQQDDAAHEQAVWRYAYGPSQRRVLAQQDVASQSGVSADTLRSRFEPGTHRRIGADATLTRYNANGQPTHLDGRVYDWDALGRLVAVHQDERTLARYGYDHRGLRNLKAVDGHTRHMLHDEARQPLAELDDEGRILRQYLWVADLPLAVIDTPDGIAPAPLEQSSFARVMGDLLRIVHSWFAGAESLAWLHLNHLGAPELVTDIDGSVLWRADYAPFGAATVRARNFTLDLRLPGQRFDAETGLHYNRARYYDPTHGQYLTPDPLGTPDGPNPYAYVAFNPLIHIDPDGLLLFAFDGTGNSDNMSDPVMNNSGLSNVVYFRDAYHDGKARYVTGVGAVHRDVRYGDIVPHDYAAGRLLWWLTPGDPSLYNDMGANYSGPARIDRMMLYLRDEADDLDDGEVMDIDIVGFSRGAAQARDFANRVAAKAIVHDGAHYYKYEKMDGSDGCQPVNFRFMGLFDTVLSTNWSGYGYQLGIPAEFAHVAQAVALNEHRSSAKGVFGKRNPRPHSQHWGGFPLESIGPTSTIPGKVRIELGFIGAHADIGGGYKDDEQGLSRVALNWMVQQAVSAGVTMRSEFVDPIPLEQVVLHDQSNVIRAGDPRKVVPEEIALGGDTPWIEYVFTEDRDVSGAVSGTRQRNMGFDNNSMTHSDTYSFITWTPRDPEQLEKGTALDPRTLGNVTGTVDLPAYLEWLRESPRADDYKL